MHVIQLPHAVVAAGQGRCFAKGEAVRVRGTAILCTFLCSAGTHVFPVLEEPQASLTATLSLHGQQCACKECSCSMGT